MINKEFQKIVPDDFEQFRNISTEFQKVKMEDYETLNRLAIDSWLLASRWSEIQSMSRKIGEQYEISKTDFSDWAYQKYRQLQELHITCRSWYRLAIEEKRQNEMIGD